MCSVIRGARRGDIVAVQAIERRAGRVFSTVGMDAVANDNPPSAVELTRYIEGGRAWVAVDAEDRPTAYVLVDRLEGAAHIAQVTVDPDSARRGLGATLIEHVDRWARAAGLDGLTLTTFTSVPWNAPYYARLGFRQLAPDELTEGLRVVREREYALGLDRWPRTAMSRPF
ncbi:GNAT family N-acetyltransferase [Tomitella gaofuii]|uniref:GNAT family N-acetyltransferase n=1 Tax=Tomitella gaofuii TaxID=2760083 RepID=UPI0015F9854B|nr:GNAT family N-acetyltransferase [Tomitella gaofuii]